MGFDRHRHHRRSIRLPGYDYGQPGAYFVTICAWRRLSLFGAVHDGVVTLNACGRIVVEEWERSESIRAEIALDAFIVMPNHVHGIVWIRSPQSNIDHISNRRGERPLAPTANTSDLPRGYGSHTLASFVAGFKTGVTRRINTHRQSPGAAVWQRNYYEHVIRDDADLCRIRTYVDTNPARWPDDPDHPDNWAH